MVREIFWREDGGYMGDEGSGWWSKVLGVLVRLSVVELWKL